MSLSRGGDYRSPKPIYSFPELKEPEKSTAWEPPKDAPVKLVDHELEKAKRRTEIIKSLMSPPGALNLPPLLEAQRWKYGIPDGAFKVQATFDRVFVFPVDQFDDEETVRGTTIIRPTLTKMKDLQEGNRGVLISAGLSAADELMSHGYELGHIVHTNKNVPFVRRCERCAEFDIFYLVMRAGDLAGSETLSEELKSGAKSIIDAGDEGSYCHQIAGRKKKSVFISDNW
jgi:hypothetical protein